MTQTYKVQVSMNQAHIVESGFVWKQGDFGFNIEIEVLDFDTTGATPQIIFRKSTGAVEATQISVAGNKFTYAIRGTELDTPGPCVCDLKLNDSTTKRVSTASFKYFVIPDTMDGLEQEASSYSDTIEQIVDGFDDEITDLNNSTEKLLRVAPIGALDTMLGFVGSNNAVGNKTSANKQIVFHVKSGDAVKAKGRSTRDTILSFCKEVYLSTNDINISSQTGYNSRKIIDPNGEYEYTVPSDAHFAVLSILINNQNASPVQFSINGHEFFDIIDHEDIDQAIETTRQPNNCWNGVGLIGPTSISISSANSLYTIIKVEPSDYIQMEGKFKRNDTVFAFLRSFPFINDSDTRLDFSTYTGFTARLSINKDAYKAFEVPADVHYLIVNNQINAVNCMPEIKINDVVLKNRRNTYNLNEYVERYGFLHQDGTWHSNNSYRSIEVPVSPGDEILIVQSHSHDNLVGFLTTKSDFLFNGTVPYSSVEGYTTRIQLMPDEVRSFIVPSDAKYFITSSTLHERTALPFKMYINGSEVRFSPKAKIQNHTQDLFKGMTCVSDTVRYRAASAPMSAISVDGIVFFDYLAGLMSEPSHYGEQGDAIGLGVFPILQPWRVEYYTVAENGETIDGVYMDHPYEPNITLIDGGVRCFFRVVQSYYYRDFSYSTKQFGTVHPMMMNGSQVTYENVKSYLEAQGKEVSQMRPALTFTSRIIEHGGYKWGTLQAYEANPIIVKSNDNFATAVPVGICPYLNMWESGIGFINDNFYMTMREDKNKFIYKTSNFINWEGIYINANLTGLQKSNIVEYKDSIYIIYSLWDAESQNDVWPGRNNIKIVRYDEKVFCDIDWLEDAYGITYPNVFEWNGIMYMLFSNSYLFKDQDPGNSAYALPQGKDSVFFTRLFEIY